MGDARRALMFQAALSKAVDYSKARLLDPAWWKYLNVMLKALEQQHGRHILELVVHYNLAKAGLDFLKTESRLDYAKEAIHRIGHIADSYEGVAPRSEQQIKADSARRLADAWVAEFGDPNDPEVAKSIEAATEALDSN